MTKDITIYETLGVFSSPILLSILTITMMINMKKVITQDYEQEDTHVEADELVFADVHGSNLGSQGLDTIELEILDDFSFEVVFDDICNTI